MLAAVLCLMAWCAVRARLMVVASRDAAARRDAARRSISSHPIDVASDDEPDGSDESGNESGDESARSSHDLAPTLDQKDE